MSTKHNTYKISDSQELGTHSVYFHYILEPVPRRKLEFLCLKQVYNREDLYLQLREFSC
jgi:hypothetical protein